MPITAAVAPEAILIGVPDTTIAGPAGVTVCPAITNSEEASAVYDVPPNDKILSSGEITDVSPIGVMGIVIPLLIMAVAEDARE